MFLIKWFFIVVYTIVIAVTVIAGAGMLYGGYVELTKEKKNE